MGAQSELTTAAQDTLLRQSAIPLTTRALPQTPAQVLRDLVRGTRPGRIPATLVINWMHGNRPLGLALTPYAIYRKAPGVYDIAVYDPNYPMRERAVHVDVNSNTWEYLTVSGFGLPAEVVGGDAMTRSLSLLPLAESLARQECPVSRGAGWTTFVRRMVLAR